MCKKIVVLGVFFCILFSCSEKSNNRQVFTNNTDIDSIPLWIQEAKNTTISGIERKKVLAKAYNTLKKASDDSVKAKYLLNLSYACYRLNDGSLFKSVNKDALQLSIQLKDSAKQALAHWDYSVFYRKNSIQDSAYYHAINAYKLYSATGDSYRAGRIQNLVSGIQSSVKDYTGAEITAIKALKLLKPLKKYNHICSSYTNLAIANRGLKEYDKALEFYKRAEEALKKYKGSNLKELQLSFKNNIAYVYAAKGDYKKAITNFKQVLTSDSLLYTDTKFYAKALNNLAYNRLKLGDTIGLQQQLEKVLHLKDSIGDIEGLAYINHNLAEYHLSKKDTLTAKKYTRQAKINAKQSKNYSRLLKILQFCTLINPNNATHYTQEYISLNDSLQQAERKIRNKFARIRFETDEYIEENEHLEEQQKILLGLILGIGLLVSAILIIIRQQIKNQKLKFKQQQQEKNQEIFNLMLAQQGKLKKALQKEQRRISAEIHDGIIGKVFGARLMLEALNDKTSKDAITDREYYVGQLQVAEETVRKISHRLYTASQQKIHNFINTVQELVDETNNYKIYKCHFRYEKNTDWDALHTDIKINVYRIIQESLQNCRKHSKAKNVFLTLDATEKHIKATIKDDGIGFIVKKERNGIGIKNIASRIESIKGTWNLKSKKHTGTTITLSIPIIKEEKENTTKLHK